MRLSEVPAETRKRLLAKSYDPARNTRVQKLDDTTYLISSGSQPGMWYEVTPSACPCQGNAEHGYCQHRLRASYETHLAKKTAEPTRITRTIDKHARAA
jgi:hypothetical protein